MVGRHQNFGVPEVESPAYLRAATDERFMEGNVIVCSISPHAGHFPQMVPWGLGLGKCREPFRPCGVSEHCPAPQSLICAFSEYQLYL